MAQEIRALVQSLIIIVVVASCMYGLLFGLINSNGGHVPVGIQQNVTHYISITNNSITGALGTASKSTASAINSTSTQATGGILGIIGFGGAITAFVGFMGAIPQTMGYIIQIFTISPFLALIVGSVLGAAILLTTTNVAFELMSWIGKYRI